MNRLPAVTLLLLFSLALFAQHQSNDNRSEEDSNGGINVRISTERVEELPRFYVQLITTTGIPITSAFSSPEGTAEFDRVRPGMYKVRVSGLEIETTETESIEVLPKERMHQVFLHIALKETAAKSPAPERPISMAAMNVPKNARKEAEKGESALQAKDPKKAIEHLQKAVEMYPQYAAAYNNLGVSWTLLGDMKAARLMFEKALEVDANSPTAYVNLSRMMMKEKDYSGAQQMLNKSLGLYPNNGDALMLLATAALLGGNYESAVATSRRLHAMPHEKFATIHLVAGEALQHQSNPAAAVQEYEQYLKESPNSPEAGKVRQAIATLSAAAAPAPAAQSNQP